MTIRFYTSYYAEGCWWIQPNDSKYIYSAIEWLDNGDVVVAPLGVANPLPNL